MEKKRDGSGEKVGRVKLGVEWKGKMSVSG